MSLNRTCAQSVKCDCNFCKNGIRDGYGHDDGQRESPAEVDLIAEVDLMIVAEKVSWQGLTRKWGHRWVAQVLTATRDRLVYECPHGHPTKRDAMACTAARERLSTTPKGNEATRREAGGRIGGTAGEVTPKA